MDVNGTKYHLLYGCQDWGSCLLQRNGGPVLLATLWENGYAEKNGRPSLEWDCNSASLRLAREVPLFKRQNGNTPLDISARRGTGRDSYGNWYWIDTDEAHILFQQNGTFTATPFWNTVNQWSASSIAVPGSFSARLPQHDAHVLRGLAVTTRDYLVVGDVTASGLQVFNLEGGGQPFLLSWPKEVAFSPWDLAATPDGGLLILDREHDTYWVLDADFRLRGDVPDQDDPHFQPCDPSEPSRIMRTAPPSAWAGYKLVTGSPPGMGSLVSIEPGPDCHVLLLESDPALDHSTIYEYQGDQQIAAYGLDAAVEVMDPAQGEGIPEFVSVLGHDFAYIADDGEAQFGGCDCTQSVMTAQPRHMIYVADHEGKQTFAFLIDCQKRSLWDQHDFLPMRHWDGKAIVASAGQVYYDFAQIGNDQPNSNAPVRWVPLVSFAECHYVGQAVFTTPANFDPDSSSPSSSAFVPGGPFDSTIPGCVWHRLFLDAQIPQGTAISIRARASDDYILLAQASWGEQPGPYLRSGGAELPYYDPWKDLSPVPEGTGTWELLFQEIQGRYLQLELVVQGNGRATPALRALRAWYPRFSYLDQYLPVVYREDPVASSFLDRWLANFEGLYTNLEDKIEHVAELFDPRTAPAETLNWLACWFGLLLDPLWDEERRRLLIGNIDKLYSWRGTAVGIEIAVRMYVEKQVDASLFNLDCRGNGLVQIVEHFYTRGVGIYAFSAPMIDSENRGVRRFVPLTRSVVASNAHRFTVMIPDGLSKEDIAMVERIVNLEKPAHTAFNLALYWEGFQAGDARLGFDTRVGRGYRYSPAALGTTSLSESYLEPPYPGNLADRIVPNRDHLGDLPAL